MWKWASGDDSASKSGVHGISQTASMSVADLTEQLAQTEQLVAQLKELVKEKDNELRSKEQQLKGCRDGDQENAAASRGKILLLKKKVEELETQNAQRNKELQKKIAELDAAHRRGVEMDAMLAEKQKKIDEKEAYIIDLQLACGATHDAKEVLVCNSELKNQLSTKEASLQSMQLLVQNLTKKVGDSEERCSLLQEQIENLKNIHSKERERFQEREAMYTQNIRMFQDIIQEKEKELIGLAQKHEQELFKLAAKSDASADLEQLLKALKQKLHEKEEVMLGRTQVIVMLQQELDAKDQQFKEVNEHLNRLQSEKDNLQSKLDAEKHVMRAQLRDMVEKHEIEMKKIKEKHNADMHEIQEKHETELLEKNQTLLQLQKQLDKLSSKASSDLEQAFDIDAVIKQKLEQLEAQVKLKTEDASKSEAKFLKMKAWSKSRIRQLEEELKNVTSLNSNVTALHDRISELQQEKEDLQSTLQTFSELKTQNEELLRKLELYEEQQRKLQADLEQVTKRAASQASESGSVDELQSQLLEWQEIVTESEDSHNQIREEKSVMALRMAQIEEEREAIVSGQQELEEELATGQGIGRMQPERRKAAETSQKLQEDYGFDGKQCYEDLNITMDSASTEGENMGGWWPEYTSPGSGLQTVVEELELERNQLQEQIIFLEERCRDLEDRMQLQGRMEALQNENDRLQSQLTTLRNQQARDAEKHQVLVSNLNEQLKRLNERNTLLETLVSEKDQKLSSAEEKLERIEDMRNSLQDKDLLNKELNEKFSQTEQKLEDAMKKCSIYGTECAEQKVIISDLTEKVGAFKEKTVKQDAVIESMRLELDQTNEELDRLNVSHLEERSQLIQDLQRREREIDNLREVLAEKDKEISSLSSTMTEYSEQVNILKCQVKCKEDEIQEMEEALCKAVREAQLLKDVQTADMKDASAELSRLSEQLSMLESELVKVKTENETKTKENEDLIRQIKENNQTIKDFNSELKSRDVAYSNKLTECEAQIKLLKEQTGKSAEKWQEMEMKYKEERDNLKSQLDEHISAKEKLNALLKEKENKEQSFVNELKSVKDLYNKLMVENAKKDEDLANLSRQFADHTEHLEIAKKSLEEKAEIIISLKDKLKVVEEEKEKEKLQLVAELNSKEMQWNDVNNELHEKQEIIIKMETEGQANILINKQLQTAFEQKEKHFVDQLKVNEDLRNEVHTMEKEKQQLISENESLSKLLDVKECELLKRSQSIAEMENKICVSAREQQEMLSDLSHEKETLRSRIEELLGLVKEKENSVSEQLLEKERECSILADQLSQSREMIKQLQEEIQSTGIKLQKAKEKELEKEAMLSKQGEEYNKIVQQLRQAEEKISSLQKQVEETEKDLILKSKFLEEKNKHNDVLIKQVEEKQVNVIVLEKQIEKFQGDSIQLLHQIETKNSALLSQGQEFDVLRSQIAKKTEECAALNDQVVLLAKEIDVLKDEKDSALTTCNAKSTECATFQLELRQQQSEIVSVKHEAHMLRLENEKLRKDINTANATLMKKCEGVIPTNAHVSDQGYDMLTIMGQIDTLVTELKTLKIRYQEKESLLSQREALIQQMKENKDAGEKQYLQMISDLQNQVQVLDSEAGQLRQEVQDKGSELKKLNQELKLLKDKSEESHLLRVQLSENMEIISDLQCQLKNVTESTELLNKAISDKDNFLKQKEEECLNLQACISESSCKQQNQIKLLIAEVEELKAAVLEKELVVNNTSVLNDKLNAELQDKQYECETLKKQTNDAEELNLSLKKEISEQKKLINDISQALAEKDVCLSENDNLMKKLSEELKSSEEKINKFTQEIQQLKELAQEKEDAFLSLQDQFSAKYEERNDLRAALSKKEDFVAELLNTLNQKDISLQLAENNARALTNEIELLREELEKSTAALKNLLQEKDENIMISQEKINSLVVEVESAKADYQKASEQIDLWKQNIQQREKGLQVAQEKCNEQAKHIEYLNSEITLINHKSSQEFDSLKTTIEKLEQQVDSLIKEKVILQENCEKLSVENKGLQRLHEKLEASENESRMHQQAFILQLENEREQLQMQVSVKCEEIGELKFKVEKLEQSLLESENRWVMEHDRAVKENEVNLEQINSLETKMKSKDVQIESLLQEQEVIKKELDKYMSTLLDSCYFIRGSDSDSGQQVTESVTMLEKFSALIDSILSKQNEAMALQQTLLEKEEKVCCLTNQLKSMQSQKEGKELLPDEFEKVENTNQFEIDILSTELNATKETLPNQQSVCEQRNTTLTDMTRQITFLQEKSDKLEKEFESSCKTLNIKCQKVTKLKEELKHKKQMIENLTSQTKQQKDLISSLTQQLKEKDCSVSQVMESMSNEMIKFSEEKNVLANKLQELEVIRSSMTEETNKLSQQVEECKKELEQNQLTLASKNATIKELLSEKEQINSTCEKISLEKENLKKKLQASLIVRKDLLQKLGKLEKRNQENIESEFNKTQVLLEQIDRLEKQVKNAEARNKDIESQLEGLKEQLREKDAKISDLNEMLCSKALYVEQLQKDVTEFKDTIAEQKRLSEKNLMYVQEKDSVLSQMQSALNEKERMYEEERSELLSTIENLKVEIANREETLKEMNKSEAILNTEGCYSDSEHPSSSGIPVNQLQKDKEILQKKLKALLIARKENTETIQKQKEEHANLQENFEKLKEDIKVIKMEHEALQENHQRKCQEFDSTLSHLYSLQKKMETYPALCCENVKLKTLDIRDLNIKAHIIVEEFEKIVSSMAVKESAVVKLHNNCTRLTEENEKFKEQLTEKSLELDRKEEEVVKLKIFFEQLEQQYKKDKDNMLMEQDKLQQQLELSENELVDLKAKIDSVNKEKDILSEKSEEDRLVSLKEIENLNFVLQRADRQISEKDEEIKYLQNSLKELEGKFDHGKEIMKEVAQFQQSLLESQEETKHFKTVLERMRQEREEFISNLTKSNTELINMKEELRQTSEENKQLLMELNLLREKVAPLSNVCKDVVLCAKDEGKNTEIVGQENRVHGADISSPLQDAFHTERVALKETTNDQDQPLTEVMQEQMAKSINGGSYQSQQHKYDTEEKIRERLQRKLQAALISRREALRENKILKEQIELLMLENKELADKSNTFEHLVSELNTEKQELNARIHTEETLKTENTRLLIEIENLTAACESLKATMETIVQEKEAFSFQLNSLKDSQTVELTGWKAKHSELKQEYESLLQAYENISNKIAEMRQVIDITRREKQEALHRVNEKESDKRELKELLQKAADENKQLKDQLKELVESQKVEILKLEAEAENQASEYKLCLGGHQKNIEEATIQNKKLTEENKQLKEYLESLKHTLEETQRENQDFSNDFSSSKSALRELRAQLGLDKVNVQSNINDSLSGRESLLVHIELLREGILEKEKSILNLNEENKIMSERLKDAEESLCQNKSSLFKLEDDCKSLNHKVVTLGEKIKILEDDKCLLQEELENVQETAYKVKNERECLETELLNYIKKLDRTTDSLKAAQVENSLLVQQLEHLKREKCNTIREKEDQQLHLIKVFEEKMKSAQKDSKGAKNKTKELQELLKEKQQEINQLQKDSIKYQEIILDFEKSEKLSQSKDEKYQSYINNAEEKLTKSNEEIQKLMEKLSLQNSLLEECKAKIEYLEKEKLNIKKELETKENQMENQRREYECQLEFSLQQLKRACQKDWLDLEIKYHGLQSEKERMLDEYHQLREEIDLTKTQNKNLQTELNDALAKLAAFAKCMSSLQNDRDRVIDEMKTWETQFKEAIEMKQQQLEAGNNTISTLREEIKAQMSQIQELKLKNSMLKEPESVMQASVSFNELDRLKAENVSLQNMQLKLASTLQSKEASLETLIKEKKYLNDLIKNNINIDKEMKELKCGLTEKEQEKQQLLLEKCEIQAELEKQVAMFDQMKILLNRKDAEISLLISSKDTELSGYLAQIQTEHRQQITEYDQQIEGFQVAKKQSDEVLQKVKDELKTLQTKADRAVQDRADFASELDALKKAISSLQNDRDSLLSKLKNIEDGHRLVLCEKERLIADSANENATLKKDLRKFLNQIDDLHSENAMLTAQLIKYREDLNHILSLKDNQLKELLTQKLETIKNLELEKLELQKTLKEMEQAEKVLEESLTSLRLENAKLTSKSRDLEIVIASINKERLASELKEKFANQKAENLEQKKELDVNHSPEEEIEKRLQEFQQTVGKASEEVEDKYCKTSSALEQAELLENEATKSSPKTLPEVQFQNKELKSQLESFRKAMTALQDDRERLIENFKVFHSKYTSELRYEKGRADRLETALRDFKANICEVLKESTLLNQALLDAKDKITVEQLMEELKNLCKLLNTQNIEICRLSSECENYAQQVDAFSKAMGSLQDNRDRLLQELCKLRVAHEAKQGTSLMPMTSDRISEISSLKHTLESLQMDRDRLVKEGADFATDQISKLKAQVCDLERDLQETKVFQDEAERERTSCQNELDGLRMEKNTLLVESQALQNQFQTTLTGKEQQLAELQRLHHKMVSQGSISSDTNYPTKALEAVALVGRTDFPDHVNHLIAERNQLQHELQRCLQELHQKELRFQKINSKVMQSVEENALLSAQLKTVSQTLRDNQLRYTDLQHRYLRLEREYHTQAASIQGSTQSEAQAEVPPGAPQERAAVVFEMDNVEVGELRKRLAEMELQYDSAQQTVSQLMEALSEERNRRQAVEEALDHSEGHIKRLEMSSFRSIPSEYTVQVESDEEREALIINASEHMIVRKVKGGTLSFKRWIRGRSLYCSKLLTSRAKSRYLFLSYLVMLHLLFFLCLTGII
uniref:Golgin subfamily B member 1-like n=1 Tax=Salvator merianae TaxID=96440 RepID=A0A8D0BF98_SALMN